MNDNFDEFSLDDDMPMENNEGSYGKNGTNGSRGRAHSAVIVQPVAATHNR